MSWNWQVNRRLSEFSTFGIGGPIRYFASPSTPEELEEAFGRAREKQLPCFILGKGSNCLFDDEGFDGIVLLNRIDFCVWSERQIVAGAGVSFSYLGIQSAKKGLSGLEFASGIPASVGGAVFMNAGANGQETSAVLESVEYLSIDGKRKHFRKDELEFRYRYSSFHEMRGAILSAVFLLHPMEEARQRQREIIEQRVKTQPLKDRSIGCIFRNPTPFVSAGRLIDQCGLKGLEVGGAAVSSMHANFIVNRKEAKSKDVLELIKQIQKVVYEKKGIYLEPEIRIIGSGKKPPIHR